MRKIPHSGRIYRRNSNTMTTYSEGYHLTITRREDVWYDVWPYSLTLWPHSSTECRRRGEWWIRRDNNSFITLELTLEGEVVYEYGEFRHVVRAGELYVTWPGDTVLMHSSEGREARQLQLIVSGGAVRLLSESLGLVAIHHFRFGEPESFEKLRARMGHFGNLLRHKRLRNAAKLSLMAYELLLFLTEKHLGGRDYELPGQLTNAVMNMESDRYCRTSVAEQAQALAISRATLARLFRNHLGTTPRDYLRQLRMESARQLLINSDFSVKEIAARLGFGTPFSFSAAFRKYVGESPSEFRRHEKKCADRN